MAPKSTKNITGQATPAAKDGANVDGSAAGDKADKSVSSAVPAGEVDSTPVAAQTVSTTATPMEVDDADSSSYASSSGPSSVNGIHGNPIKTAVHTDVINGNASSNVVFPTNSNVHGNEAMSSAMAKATSIQGNAVNVMNSGSNTMNAPTFYNIPVPQGFATPISSDERLKLMNEIERLRLMVFKTTIESIRCPQGSIVPENLGVLRNQLETAERTYELVFGRTESTLVPNETPYFQWRGHFFNKRRAVFATPNDCLDHFELVLQAHRLSIHDNWERIVPAKLSTGMARWYASLVAKQGRLTWSEFRNAVINKYGKSIVDMRDEAREQLEKLEYQQGQSFNQFVDRFQQLRNQADIQDEDCVVRYLIKSLPEELANYTKFSLNTTSDREQITVDVAVNKITAIYNALFKEKWEREKAASSTVSNNPIIEKGFNSSSSTVTNNHPIKKCIYHPNARNHRTKDCKASDNMKRRIDAAQKKFGDNNTRICHDCKEPNWTPAHKSVCKMKHCGIHPL